MTLSPGLSHFVWSASPLAGATPAPGEAGCAVLPEWALASPAAQPR